MLMPSIFGENLFDDDWMDFPFERFDRDFWGKKNPLYRSEEHTSELQSP